MKMEATKSGTSCLVKYILQLPSGDTSMYTGWPDFQMLQCFSRMEERLGRHKMCKQRVRGIGEVQSPPGVGEEAKDAALAQASIYTVEQFAKMRCATKGRILTVILYKNITAHIAIATVDPM